MRILLFAAFLVSAGPASGALDPELKTPYQLNVVLLWDEHPNFTNFFHRDFARQLRNQLQAALGPLGKVDVTDLSPTTISPADLTPLVKEDWPPLWRIAEEKGLQAVDTFHDVGGGKTHFLKISFQNDQYVIQARQHDGTSGFVTPIVRDVRTADRGHVARLAALTIGRDFGFVATLDPQNAGERVFLKAKAAGLGPIDKWVKKGDVFAVVALRPERRKVAQPKGPPKTVTVQTGSRVDGILLQVDGDPTEGLIPCRVYNRYEDPLPRGVTGFRCVKLGTTTAPLRLRLVDQTGLPPKAAGLQVHARADSYPDGDKEHDQAVLRDGVYTSKEPLANIALVRVLLGTRRVARIPVEILDDRVETQTIRLDPGAEQRERLDAERRELLGRLTDNRLIQVRLFQEITALEQEGDKPEAMKRGETGHRQLDTAAADLQDEIAKLQGRAAKELPKADRFADDCERVLQGLRTKQTELKQHLEALRASIAQDNDPAVVEKKKKVQDLIRTAELLVTQAEYDRALKQYEAAIAAAADEPAARQRIEAAYNSLKKAWEVRPGDAAHATARAFILNTWPKLATPDEVSKQLPAARQAFEKCKAVGDRLAVNKMQQSAVEVASRFGDELKKFAAGVTEDEDRKTLEGYQKVNESLIALLKEIQDYMTGK